MKPTKVLVAKDKAIKAPLAVVLRCAKAALARRSSCPKHTWQESPIADPMDPNQSIILVCEVDAEDPDILLVTKAHYQK